jgi:hypothetical protein
MVLLMMSLVELLPLTPAGQGHHDHREPPVAVRPYMLDGALEAYDGALVLVVLGVRLPQHTPRLRVLRTRLQQGNTRVNIGIRVIYIFFSSSSSSSRP